MKQVLQQAAEPQCILSELTAMTLQVAAVLSSEAGFGLPWRKQLFSILCEESVESVASAVDCALGAYSAARMNPTLCSEHLAGIVPAALVAVAMTAPQFIAAACSTILSALHRELPLADVNFSVLPDVFSSCLQWVCASVGTELQQLSVPTM